MSLVAPFFGTRCIIIILKSEKIKTKNLEELEVRIVDSFETFVQQNCAVALQSHGQPLIIIIIIIIIKEDVKCFGLSLEEHRSGREQMESWGPTQCDVTGRGDPGPEQMESIGDQLSCGES